jgi:hypothetical protein
LSLNIQFSTSTAFTSGVIRRLTHSQFSHVDFLLPDGLLGVSGVDPSISDLGGVLIRPFGCWPYLTKPKVARINCSDETADKVIAAAKTQLGKPFDNSAMWGMLNDQAEEKIKGTARNWRDPSQWFCSELVAWAMETGGLFPYKLAVMKSRVSPADVLLLANPFLDDENVQEFMEV